LKVLVLAGAPVNSKNRYEESRPIARIWQDKDHELVVDPIDDSLWDFVDALIEHMGSELDKRPEGVLTYHVGSESQPHAMHRSFPADDDYLEAVMGDTLMWGSSNMAVIGGYYILPSFSNVINE